MTGSDKKFEYSQWYEAIAFMLLGLVPRLILLFHNQAGIESDEAVVGLMGKHILEGYDVPIFYYGQAYMGSLEAICAAASFYFFGINNYALKLVPLTFSILFIGIVYACGLLLAGKPAARIAALLVAIPPSPLVIWSLKARGGFIETLFIGSLAIFFSLVLLKREKSNYIKDRTLWILISVFLGLGWWTNNQIIFYIAPLGIVLFLKLLSYKSPLIIAKITFLSLLGFVLGGLPFWYHNIFMEPAWSSFEVLFGSTAGGNAAKYFSDYWNTALPIILGARQFWSDADIYHGATTYAYTLYALTIISAVVLHVVKPDNRFSKKSILSVFFLVLFLIFVPTIFSLSSFGWLSKAPRYLLPLYSVIPLLTGLCIARLITQKSFIFRSFGGLLIIAHLCLNLNSNYLHGIADEGQPIIYKKERVAEDHSELYEWLNAQGYTHIYTNYWVGYRVAFETNEKITFTRFGNPRTSRILKYESENPHYEVIGKVFVLAHGESKFFEHWMHSVGLSFRETELEHYTILDQIKYVLPEGELIPVSLEQISFFIPPWGEEPSEIAKNVNALIDNDPKTRWGSGKPQSPGMAIEIKFREPENIVRIVLDHSGFPHDTPNSLKISGYHAETGELVTIYDMRAIPLYKEIRGFSYASIPALWDIRFEEIPLQTIRLELMDGIPIFDWSMNGIRLYRLKDQ